MRDVLIGAVAAFALTACGSSPKKSETPTDGTAKPRFELTYEDVMEFERGVEGRYEIKGQFRDEGATAITVDGLPAGARFEDGVLTWLPPCDLKPDDGFFQRGYWLIRVRINLRHDRTDSLVQRPALIIVHQTRQPPVCPG